MKNQFEIHLRLMIIESFVFKPNYLINNETKTNKPISAAGLVRHVNVSLKCNLKESAALLMQLEYQPYILSKLHLLPTIETFCILNSLSNAITAVYI